MEIEVTEGDSPVCLLERRRSSTVYRVAFLGIGA